MLLLVLVLVRVLIRPLLVLVLLLVRCSRLVVCVRGNREAHVWSRMVQRVAISKRKRKLRPMLMLMLIRFLLVYSRR